MKKALTGILFISLLSMVSGAKAALVTVTPNTLDAFLSGSFKATLTSSGMSTSATGSASLQVKADLSAYFSSGATSVTLDTAALELSARVSTTAKLPVDQCAHLVSVNVTANASGIGADVIADLYVGQTTPASTIEITKIVEDVAKDPEMKDNLGQFIKDFRSKYKGKKGRDFAKAMKIAKEEYKAKRKNGKPAPSTPSGSNGNGKGKK